MDGVGKRREDKVNEWKAIHSVFLSVIGECNREALVDKIR
jgi:hypothetical protein